MAEVTLDRRAAQQGDLPAVCIYTGAPATMWKRVRFVGPTPLTIFVGQGFPSARLPMQAGLAPRTGLWLSLLVALTLATVTAGFALGMWFALPLLGLTLIVRTLWFYRDVHCIELTWDSITLRNVSPEFVQACYKLSNEEEVLSWQREQHPRP